MKNFNFLYILFVILALTGCQKEYENITTTEIPDDDDTIMLVDGSVTGSIIDQEGNKIDGATVQVIVNGTVLHETTSVEGDYFFNDISLSPSKNLIKAFSDSHSSNYTILNNVGNSVQIVKDIKIVQNDKLESFDISNAINFEGVNISVNISSESLSNFSNEINLAAKYYNFSEESRALYGIRDAAHADGSVRKANFSHGVYVIGRHSSGQLAKIKDGFSYEIRFAAFKGEKPEEIDVWHFNEREIVWKKQHTAVLDGNVYTFNADEFGHYAVESRQSNDLLSIELDTTYITAGACSSSYTLPDIDVAGNNTITWESSHKEGEFASGDNLEFSIADSPVILTVYVTGPENTSTSQELEVVIEDNLEPIAVCNSLITISFDNEDTYTLSAEDVDAGSNDNGCSEVNALIGLQPDEEFKNELSISKAQIKESNFVLLQVIDGGGNIATCFSELKVIDTVSPTANCKTEFEVSISSSGDQFINVGQLNQGSFDDFTENTDLTFSFDENEQITLKEFTCNDEANQTVKIWVWDEAGNKNSCQTTITILDPLRACSDQGGNDDEVKPTVHCHNEISTAIEGPNGEVTIWAKDFDMGSYDDMTDASELIFSFEQVNNVPSYTFDCDDLQSATTYPLKMWVWDSAGNKDFCPVTLLLDDTYGVCSGTNNDSPPVALCIMQMSVKLNVGSNTIVYAEDLDDGSFSTLGQELTFSIKKNTPGGCRSDTDDFEPMITFCSDDLGVVNNIVTLRVMDEEGRYSDCAVSVNVAPANPSNESCAGSSFHSIIIDDTNASNGANICIPVTGKNFKNVASLQGATIWDENILSFTHINDGALINGEENDANASNGVLTYVWLDFSATNPVTVDDGGVLFEICFDVVGNMNQTTTVSFTDMPDIKVEISSGDVEVPHCTQEGVFRVN